MHTNASMMEMFQRYGDRICAIGLNNGKRLLIGYRGENSTQLRDISFETIDGVDLMVVKKVDISSGRKLHFKDYITTEFIEYVLVMDEEDADYRIDPFHL